MIDNRGLSMSIYRKEWSCCGSVTETESDYRGGKYECEVLEWTLDSGTEGKNDTKPKTVLALPPMNTLKVASRELHGA